jgi:hypothetical protein
MQVLQVLFLVHEDNIEQNTMKRLLRIISKPL